MYHPTRGGVRGGRDQHPALGMNPVLQCPQSDSPPKVEESSMVVQSVRKIEEAENSRRKRRRHREKKKQERR